MIKKVKQAAIATPRGRSARPSNKKKNPPRKPRVQSATAPISVVGPIFGDTKQPQGTNPFKGPMKDQAFYNGLNLKTLYPIPPPRDGANVPPEKLTLSLDDVHADPNATKSSQIQAAGRIVFHATGDTGPVFSSVNVTSVIDKMVGDFNDADPSSVPKFFFHLGDVVYNFGEEDYYYQQFYDPYRDYPAPILAIPGNHDIMTWDQSKNPSMSAFLRHFCNKPWVKLPEAGGLSRTAMIQPCCYFRFDAPFVTIIGLNSNGSEDPGVISSEGNPKSVVTDEQLTFLIVHLQSLKKSNYAGAVLLAVHHPPYAWAKTHTGSPRMLKDIDDCCQKAGFYPHAIVSGHAHNYQRYTRKQNGRDVPFIVCGCGGYNARPLATGSTPPRTPVVFGNVTFERYFERNFGYMRIIVSDRVLRFEYHDTTLGNDTLSPADAVNIDIQKRILTTELP